MVEMKQGFYIVRPDSARATQIPVFHTEKEAREILASLEVFLSKIPHRIDFYNPTDKMYTDKIHIIVVLENTEFCLYSTEWLLIHSNGEINSMTDEAFKKRYRMDEEGITW